MVLIMYYLYLGITYMLYIMCLKVTDQNIGNTIIFKMEIAGSVNFCLLVPKVKGFSQN